MYERFTDRARKVCQLASQEAQRFNHAFIGTEHLLIGLLKEGSGVAANVLRNMGLELGHIRRQVEKNVEAGPDIVSIGKLPHTLRLKAALEMAVEESKELEHNYVGTEHLLLGLLHDDESGSMQVLRNHGVSVKSIREGVMELLGGFASAIVDSDKPPRDKAKEMEWLATVVARTVPQVTEIVGGDDMPKPEIVYGGEKKGDQPDLSTDEIKVMEDAADATALALAAMKAHEPGRGFPVASVGFDPAAKARAKKIAEQVANISYRSKSYSEAKRKWKIDGPYTKQLRKKYVVNAFPF